MGNIIQAIGWAFLPGLAWPAIYLFMSGNAHATAFSKALIMLIDNFTFRVGETVKWLLPILVLSVAASVFALSIFGFTTTKWLESSKYFQALIIMFGAAATLLASQHVRVDIFHTRMSDKAKARVDLFGFSLLLAPVCVLLVWNSQSFVAFAWNIREGSSEADGIRGVYLLKTLIPVFAVSMLAQGLAIATRAAMCLAGQERPLRPGGTPAFFRSALKDVS